MGIIWSKSGSIEWDSNGDQADGALAYFFVGNTSTPFPVYQDAGETTPHEHPVEADGNGRWPTVFIPFADSYDVRGTTAGGTQLFYPQEIPNPAPFTEDFELDEDTIFQTGDFLITGKNATRAGFVRCNGRTIGSASSSATERANADTEDLFTLLWDFYANSQAAVSGGRGGSAAADFAANKRITLPDYRATALVGFDDMGNTALGGFANAPAVSGGATSPGSVFGANIHTLTEAQLPSHTHTFSATTGNPSATHTHSISITSATESQSHTHTGTSGTESADHTHGVTAGTQATQVFGGGGTGYTALTSSGGTITSGGKSATHTHTTTTGNASQTHTHSVSGTSGTESANHTHSVSGTSGSTGSGTAHNILQLSGLVTIHVKL